MKEKENLEQNPPKKIGKDGISVVIPVYDSESILPELIERLTGSLTALKHDFEIILVNDGSQDQSWSEIRRMASESTAIRGLELMRNYGQHNALLSGIREVRYNLTVTLDDDLQNPPEEIGKLLNKLEEGYDVVYGKPDKEQHGLWRNMASWITKIILKEAMKAETARNTSAFRIFRTDLRRGFANFQGPHVSVDVLLTWSTKRFAAIPVKHDPRHSGESKYTLWKLLSHALNMMTGFSTFPLRFASILGFSFTLLGICILIYVLGRLFLEGKSIPGFPFLASTIAIFAGVQLFALGIIGEYLARIHMRTMDRPPYAIRQVTDTSKKTNTHP